MKYIRLCLIAQLALLVASCGTYPLGDHHPSLESVRLLRQDSFPHLQVGDFAPAPELRPRQDKSVTIRSVMLVSPDEASFAKYLQKTVETDLRAAGKLDSASPIILKGLLKDSQVDGGLGDGKAILGAHFALEKHDKVIFQKDISVRADWPSSFVGAIAIPDAVNHYSSLFGKLSTALFKDEDFNAALHAP